MKWELDFYYILNNKDLEDRLCATYFSYPFNFASFASLRDNRNYLPTCGRQAYLSADREVQLGLYFTKQLPKAISQT